MRFLGPFGSPRPRNALLEKLAGIRLISTEKPDPSLIILNAREAGLLRLKPRKLNKRAAELSKPLVTPLDTFGGSENEPETVVSAIHSQQPETAGITKQRFDKIRAELTRGFKKSHLEEYLKANMKTNDMYRSNFKKFTKARMAQHIMTNVWNCFVRADSSQSEGVFVENVLDLSEQEFVLVLGGNGRLLRDWSKTGARIGLSPARSQIIVNSTQDTFDWINASLSSFLETTLATEIDISELKKLVDPGQFSQYLAVIQQLTDTYFQGNYETDTSIIAYSAGNNKFSNAEIVKRMLVQLTQSTVSRTWKPAEWWFDTNAVTQSNAAFMPFDDLDSMEWTERMSKWSRWELVKTKQSAQKATEEQSIELRRLRTPEFGSSAEVVEPSADMTDQLERIVRDLCKAHPPPSGRDEAISTTLTVTPGYVLHKNDGDHIVPNAGVATTFNTNIPFISTQASALPLFNQDVRHMDSEAAPKPSSFLCSEELEGPPASEEDGEPSPTSNLEADKADTVGGASWSDLLNMDSDFDSEGNKVFVNRRKDLTLPTNLRLVQMKFVANPEQGLATRYPPIEAWADLPSMHASSTALLKKYPRVFAVLKEASSYAALPTLRADLKVTLSHTYPIKRTPSVDTYFMKKCRFGRASPIEIPPELQVEMDDGETVSYSYHSASYVTLAELEYHGKKLEFSQVEGGKLGGRRVEASLVEHTESAGEFDVEAACKTAAVNARSVIELL